MVIGQPKKRHVVVNVNEPSSCMKTQDVVPLFNTVPRNAKSEFDADPGVSRKVN